MLILHADGPMGCISLSACPRENLKVGYKLELKLLQYLTGNSIVK